MYKNKLQAIRASKRHTLAANHSLFIRIFSSLTFWITLWSIMFVYFFTIDLLNLLFGERLIPRPLLDAASLVKVCTIFTCFLYASFFAPKDYLLRFALLFTFLADIILLYNNISPIGVIIFCLAQYFHIARYASLNPKIFILWSIFNLLILSFARITDVSPLYGVAFIYANTLILNLILARYWIKREAPKFRRAALCNFFGFTLFICCDLTVVISYLARINILPFSLFAPANFICWLFYFPSQILLTNSSLMTTPYYQPFDSKLKDLEAKSKLAQKL